MRPAEDPNLVDLKRLLRRLERLDADSAPLDTQETAAEASPASKALKLQKAILDQPANDLKPDEALAKLSRPNTSPQADTTDAPDFPVIVKPKWPVEGPEEQPIGKKEILRTVLIASCTAALVSALATGVVLYSMGVAPSFLPEREVAVLEQGQERSSQPLTEFATTKLSTAGDTTSPISENNNATITEQVDVLAPAETNASGSESAPVSDTQAAGLNSETVDLPTPSPAIPASEDPPVSPTETVVEDSSEVTFAAAATAIVEAEPDSVSAAQQTTTDETSDPSAAVAELSTATSEPQTGAADAPSTAVALNDDADQQLAQEVPASAGASEDNGLGSATAPDESVPLQVATLSDNAQSATPVQTGEVPAANALAADFELRQSEPESSATSVASLELVPSREAKPSELQGDNSTAWKTAGILTYAPSITVSDSTAVAVPIALGANTGNAALEDGSYLLVSGLTRGTRLSQGTELMFDTWRVPLKSLGDLQIAVPASFARRVPVSVELRAADGATVEQFDLAIELPNAQSVGFAAPSSDAQNLPAEVIHLVDAGEVEVDNGHLAAARLYFSQAANAGSGRAMMLLAASFDPANSKVFQTNSAAPADLEQARQWYERAAEVGVVEARERIDSLSQ
ncbi:MAG: hypothetical protein RIC14_03800 [Filomicrobium sp.]